MASTRDQLYSWCIVRLLPRFQRVTVARFRRRGEAENHLRVLRRLIPTGAFVIVFVPPEPIRKVMEENSDKTLQTRL